ncbi:MAG: DUF58 domain-containing protein [Lachnospiraceae bacterium]|nr:DUF58 domain-containing protein [Lachnospiraceae bacterium]
MEEKLFDADFFRSLQRVSLISGQRMNGGRGGMRRSSSRGGSVEFSDFREYLPGDDIRRIDWNAYARSERLFIKLFMQEQEGMYTIVLDNSASMTEETGKKSVMSARLAGLFGHLALQAQDRIRLATIASGVTKVEKGLSGMQSRTTFLEQLQRVEFAGGTDLWGSLRKIPFPRRGTTIVLSDFMDRDAKPGNMEQIKEALRYLRYRKQEILLVQIMADEEIRPSLEGTICLVDEETEEKMKITMSGKLLRQYEKQQELFRRELQEIARGYQAYFMQVHTGMPLEQVIYQGMRQGMLEHI